MKKIGIDCRFASTNSGSGTYVRNVVKHLMLRNDPIAYKLFVMDASEAWLSDLPYSPSVQVTPYRHYSLDEQRHFPNAIKRSGVEVLFSPQFNVPLLCPVSFVAVIHDLILHRYPNNASLIKQFAYNIVMQNTIAKSSVLIAVSRFTADELIGKYGDVLSGKTHVVTEGYDDIFSPASDDDIQKMRNAYNLSYPYILYVGNAKEHKHVQMLIDAHEKSGISQQLVLVCHGKEVQHLSYSDSVHILDCVEESDLPALYSAADCFVTASAYEGFGLPIIEARACGTKVIAANVASIPEAAEGNALLVDHSVEAFTKALQSIDAAPEPVQPTFSWKETASSIADILLTKA